MSRNRKPLDRGEAESELEILIREAHAAMRDLRSMMKEAREAEVRVRDLVAAEVSKDVAEEVREQLEKLGETINVAMRKAVAKVDGEFQRLSNLYIYGQEVPHSDRASLGDLLLQHRAKGGAPPLGMPRRD